MNLVEVEAVGVIDRPGEVRFDGLGDAPEPIRRNLKHYKFHSANRTIRFWWWGGGYDQPVSDFPDWQKITTAMGSNLFSAVSQNLAPGNYPTAVIPVTSYSSLSAVILPTSGAGQLVVQHWADAAGTISAEADTWRFQIGAALVMRTPLRAPYMQLTLKVTSAGNLVASTWATLLASSSDRVTYPVKSQQAGNENQTLGGGVLAQWRLPAVVAGPAMLAFWPSDTTGKLAVSVVATDELNTVKYTVMPAVTPTTVLMQPLQLPDDIIVIDIKNTDTLNHAYGVSLIWPPG